MISAIMKRLFLFSIFFIDKWKIKLLIEENWASVQCTYINQNLSSASGPGQIGSRRVELDRITLLNMNR